MQTSYLNIRKAVFRILFATLAVVCIVNGILFIIEQTGMQHSPAGNMFYTRICAIIAFTYKDLPIRIAFLTVIISVLGVAFHKIPWRHAIAMTISFCIIFIIVPFSTHLMVALIPGICLGGEL